MTMTLELDAEQLGLELIQAGWRILPVAYPSFSWGKVGMICEAEKPETVGQGLGGMEGWRCSKDVVVMARLIYSDLYDLNSL